MMELFVELLKTVLFGIVQGITEWLPVSSTGHMILLNEFLTLDVSEAFMEMFEVVIQLGSILAVVVLFFHKLNPFSPRKTSAEKSATYRLWLCVIIAIIPSGLTGVLLDDWFNEHFFNWYTVAIALILYGVIFIIIERIHKNHTYKINDTSAITYKTAFMIGIFQILAIIPGTSRSGSTIIGAMLLGLSRTAAAEFSFLMAIPTMLGASGLKAVKFVLDGEAAMGSAEWLILAVGSLVAFLVSLFAIRFLMDFVKRHSFTAFGIYRIILGAAVIAYFTIEALMHP